MKVENPVVEKSRSFAIRIVKLHVYLVERKKEFVLSKQLLRSGTSIGANIREGTRAQSRNDFISKMNIALKECAETDYWLDLLHETKYLSTKQFEAINIDCQELLRLLASIVKTSRTRKA